MRTNGRAVGLAERAGRVPGMAGLRAIACLTVFLANMHHAMGLPVSGRLGPFDAAYYAESGLGVVLLIVLSGCLLSLPLWRAMMTGATPPSWLGFALRRIARIAPPYYACLAVLVVLRDVSDPRDVIAHLLLANNLWESSFYTISPQFWTIGMFAQFYVLLPVIFLAITLITSDARRAVLVVVLASAVVYLLHVALMATRSTWLVWPLSIFADPNGFVLSHSTLAHLPQFLFGVAAGSSQDR